MLAELTPIAEQTEQTKPKEIEKSLLTEIANDAHVSNWRDLRWYAVGNPPRSIVVVKRGSKPVQTVCTISKTHNPEAWQTWQPVLAEWQAEKSKTNGKRVSHDKLKTGKI